MSWQEAIQAGLERRDQYEKAYSRIIEHCELSVTLRVLTSSIQSSSWTYSKR